MQRPVPGICALPSAAAATQARDTHAHPLHEACLPRLATAARVHLSAMRNPHNQRMLLSGTCLGVECLPEARRAHDGGGCCGRERHHATLVPGHGRGLHCVLLQALQDAPLSSATLCCLRMALQSLSPTGGCIAERSCPSAAWDASPEDLAGITEC